jgi:hypothetical protein
MIRMSVVSLSRELLDSACRNEPNAAERRLNLSGGVNVRTLH